VALHILECNKDKLIHCHDDGEGMQVLIEFLNGIYNPEFSMKRADDKLQNKTIISLLYEAYAQFGEIVSTDKIENLRNQQRRQTVMFPN
jgi:TBC1 domain family member 8/9